MQDGTGPGDPDPKRRVVWKGKWTGQNIPASDGKAVIAVLLKPEKTGEAKAASPVFSSDPFDLLRLKAVLLPDAFL